MKLKSLTPNNRLFFEFISVSFAVFLALFVNQCRDNYTNDKLAQQSLKNTRLEIVANKDIMVKMLAEHTQQQNFIDSIIPIFNEFIEKGDSTSLEVTFKLLNSTSWQTAKLTQVIVFMDLELVSDVSRVYQFQNYYEELIKEYIKRNIFTINEEIDIEDLKNMQKLLTTIIPIENKLLELYNFLLDDCIPEKI